MGMFDWVTVEVPLPDGFSAESFQTKSFDNLLDNLKITREGRLELLHYDLEESKEGKVNVFGNPLLVRVNEEWVEWNTPRGTPFHGEFNFYETDEENHWHVYVAVFEHGQLKEIVILEGDSDD